MIIKGMIKICKIQVNNNPSSIEDLQQNNKSDLQQENNLNRKEVDYRNLSLLWVELEKLERD